VFGRTRSKGQASTADRGLDEPSPERPDITRQEAGMKNAEKPKKMQKKVAQKTLKEKRSEKKAKEQAR
jgi:hypothetical protein